MRTAHRPLACLLAAVVLGAVVPARAEPMICEVLSTTVTAGTFEFFCQAPISCEASADVCASSGYTMPVCGTSLMDLPTVCRPHCGTVVGCSGDADCRRFRDALGICHLVGATDPAFGVCAYPALGVTYCTSSALDSAAFARCHTRPDGSATSNYFEGNCDGDPCPNGSDPTPCVFSTGPCTALDLTVACSSTSIDAGVPDGGNVADAGTAVIDASVELDAGPTEPVDAGMADRVDAGMADRVDAGSSAPFDAPSSVPVSFGGGGGCRCVVGAGAPAAPSMMALAVLGLMLRWRSSRRG